MKDVYGEITYKDKTYTLAFNLNVMEIIQEEYGTVGNWAELTDKDEPDARAIIFGFKEMLNEGIDMDNEKNGTNDKPFTHKQVGRMITEIGLAEATLALKDTVINSTRDEKNA